MPDRSGEVPGEVGREKGVREGGISNIQAQLDGLSRKPEKCERNGRVACPGGGYSILAYEHEGSAICEWLNSLGITGFLLKYRVPRRKNRFKHEAPLQDAQRAMGMIRKNAVEWKVDPDRLAFRVFSGRQPRGDDLDALPFESYPKAADELSCRPSFGILIYPAYLVDRKNGTSFFPRSRSKETPPCFFAHTGDDGCLPRERTYVPELENSGEGKRAPCPPLWSRVRNETIRSSGSHLACEGRGMDESHGVAEEVSIPSIGRAVRYHEHGEPGSVLKLERFRFRRLARC